MAVTVALTAQMLYVRTVYSTSTILEYQQNFWPQVILVFNNTYQISCNHFVAKSMKNLNIIIVLFLCQHKNQRKQNKVAKTCHGPGKGVLHGKMEGVLVISFKV